MIIEDSASLWCFAVRRCAQAMARSLVKYSNAAAGPHRDALRVCLSQSTDCVAPLVNGAARAGPASEASALGLTCEARLAVNSNKQTEFSIIIVEGAPALWKVGVR